MKKEKKINLMRTIELYLNYMLQGSSIIVLVASLIIYSIALILIANPSLSLEEYYLAANDYHINYLNQTVFIILLLNSVIISSLIIIIIIQADSFDKLFISYQKRIQLALGKLLGVFIIILIISAAEVVIFNSIGYLIFPLYKPNYNMLFQILIIFFSSIFEAIIGIVVATIIKNMLIPMSIMFIFMCFRVICNNFIEVKEITCKYMPIIVIDDINLALNCNNFVIILFLFLTILYIFIFNITEIN